MTVNTSRTRVVIVEDVELEAKLVTRALADHGYSEIVHVKDATQALAATADGRPAILLVDVELGAGGNGIDIVRKVRSRGDGVAYAYAIVLTSRGSSARVQEAFEAGADDFVTKPVQHHELIARIQAGERLIRIERTLAVKAAELESTLRAINPDAAAAAILRAAEKMHPHGSSAIDQLIEALPWEKMSSVLRTGLEGLVGEPFASTKIGDRPAALVGEVCMAEATRQLELGVTVVADGASSKKLAGIMLGDENDLEGACALILEVANVLMGCLKTAYIDHGYSFTVGLPTQSVLADARATYDAFAHRQRFAFAIAGLTLEVWVRASEKQNKRVKGKDLREGMILVDDVRDERGMLLVRGGTRLTATTADRLAGLVPLLSVTVN